MLECQNTCFINGSTQSAKRNFCSFPTWNWLPQIQVDLAPNYSSSPRTNKIALQFSSSWNCRKIIFPNILFKYHNLIPLVAKNFFVSSILINPRLRDCSIKSSTISFPGETRKYSKMSSSISSNIANASCRTANSKSR